MKILPASLRPWRTVIQRQHHPPARQGRYGYRHYRQCLRWEFGFTCPFCLCHEADIVPRGAEGLGVTQIEHFDPVSSNPDDVNTYENCYYICINCNLERNTADVEVEEGPCLLNPCSSAWAEHFTAVGDHIEPKAGDRDAVYTAESYGLNNLRKIELRRHRRETVEECLEILQHGQAARERLIAKATQTHDSELIAAALIVEDALRKAYKDLETFAAVPVDAETPCACKDDTLCELPKALDEQTIQVTP